jgi:hypothetical protein
VFEIRSDIHASIHSPIAESEGKPSAASCCDIVGIRGAAGIREICDDSRTGKPNWCSGGSKSSLHNSSLLNGSCWRARCIVLLTGKNVATDDADADANVGCGSTFTAHGKEGNCKMSRGRNERDSRDSKVAFGACAERYRDNGKIPPIVGTAASCNSSCENSAEDAGSSAQVDD